MEVIMKRTHQFALVVLLLSVASPAYADVISNIRFSPGPVCSVPFGQYVNLTFDYSITTPGGVKIFPRPFTNGALTPQYGASGSPLYTGTGSGTAYFTISSGDVTVDHVRFRVYNSDQSQLILEFFVPVMYKFSAHGIFNIQITPPSPASLKLNEHLNISFDYVTSEATGVRLYCEPMFHGTYAPGGAYQGSTLHSTGSGSVTRYVTVLSGQTPLDAVRFSMWTGDNTTEIQSFMVPVRCLFAGTAIQNIEYTPLSPNGLVFGEKVNANFTYSTNEAAGIKIFVRPYTDGSYSSNYAAHGSGLYPAGSGNASGWFTINSQETTVDSLVFHVYDAAGTTLLLSYYLPVNIHYSAHKVTDVIFTPPPPAYFTTGHYDSLQFSYTHTLAGGAYLWALPRANGETCPGTTYSGSTVLPTGSATLKRVYSILSGTQRVDATRFLMQNTAKTETLLSWDVPVEFYYGNQTIVGVREPVAQPATFALEQNYPNPFNPTTTIRFTVGGVAAPSGAFSGGVEPFESPQGSTLSPPKADRRIEGPASHNVKLTIYDLLGREVAVLVNERRPAGNHEVRFDGSGLSSGVYLYRLTAGPYVESRKMLLIR
jgi:hypothetical protein